MPEVRQATAGDIPAILSLQKACYPHLSTLTLWHERHLRSHQRNFPEGQFVATVAGRVVGYCATFRTTSAQALQTHTFGQITQRGSFDGHDPGGDVLYGAEIMVHPDQRRRGIGRMLYEARFALMDRLGIPRFVAGGRLPGYYRFAGIMDAQHYVDLVARGELTDRVLTPQIRSGLRPVGVLPGYLGDPKSGGYASLLLLDRTRTPRDPAGTLAPQPGKPARKARRGSRQGTSAAPRRTQSV